MAMKPPDWLKAEGSSNEAGQLSESGSLKETIEEYKKRTTEKSRTFDAITPEIIERNKKWLQDEHGVDFSDISIELIRPGDQEFDETEITQKFRKKYANETELLEKLSSYNPELNEDGHPTFQSWKRMAEQDGIKLDGRLTGFLNTTDHKRIGYYAIHEDEVINMATNYAVKEGELNRNFPSADGAKEYLRNLGDLYFTHEMGHIFYYRMLNEEFSIKWKAYINARPDLIDKVKEIQKDKYGSLDDIPIFEEAFADMTVEVINMGKKISRLGKIDEEGYKLVREILLSGGVTNI